MYWWVHVKTLQDKMISIEMKKRKKERKKEGNK